MNTRNMNCPRIVDTRWPQTIQLERRRAPRTKDHPYRRHQQRQREPINWGLVLMVAGAGFIACAALLYKLTGPAL
jgi:hypothetical protein